MSTSIEQIALRLLNSMGLKKDIKEYFELLDQSFTTKLAGEDSSLTNAISFELTKNHFLFILHEPSESILNFDLKNKVEQIISSTLFPKWVVQHEAGLNLVALPENDADSARGLLFHLHYGLYERLTIKSLSNDLQLFDNGKELAIQLQKSYFWKPAKSPHLAVMANTRSGKSTLFLFLLQNCLVYSRISVKNGAIDDHNNPIIVIDPKRDPHLRKFTKNINGRYIAPDFSKNDNNFVATVCDILKEVMDIVHDRAIQAENNPEIKFKDLWLTIDELLAIPAMATSKQKGIYFSLLDRLLLMAASVQVHILTASQSYLSGQALSSQARLQFSMRILLTPKVTTENAQFLFKELDSEAINNLIIDFDKFGSLAVGIASNGLDGMIVPFKSPFLAELGGK